MQFSSQRIRLAWVILLLASLMIACAPTSRPVQTAAPTNVRVAVAVHVLTFAPLHWAEAKGLFQKQNLKVELQQLVSGASMAALLNGDIEFNSLSNTELYKVVESKTDIMAVQRLSDLSNDFVIRKDVLEKRGIRDGMPVKEVLERLKGAKLVVTSLGGGPHLFGKWLIQKYLGVDPEKNFEFVNISAFPARIAAVREKQADGLVGAPPHGGLLESGAAKVVIQAPDVPEFKGIPYGVLAVKKDYLKNNERTVQAMTTALAEAHDQLATLPAEEVAKTLLTLPYYTVELPVMTAAVKSLQYSYGNKGRMDAKSLEQMSQIALEMGITKALVPLVAEQHWTNKYTN